MQTQKQRYTRSMSINSIAFRSFTLFFEKTINQLPSDKGTRFLSRPGTCICIYLPFRLCHLRQPSVLFTRPPFFTQPPFFYSAPLLYRQDPPVVLICIVPIVIILKYSVASLLSLILISTKNLDELFLLLKEFYLIKKNLIDGKNLPKHYISY